MNRTPEALDAVLKFLATVSVAGAVVVWIWSYAR